MATAAATMNMATHHPRARTRARLYVCAAWDMNPGAATVAVPKPSKAKPKPPPTPARPPPPTHADLFARSSEGQDTGAVKKSTYMGFEKWWLPPPPEVKKPRSLYSAASLAYLGDCIYELYARRHFFFPPLSINEYNKRVMDVVKCESQDLLLNKLLGEDFLTQEERDILRWGRNIVSSKTRTRKRAGIAVYNRASSLETLIGYLYLTNFKRLEQLMFQLGFTSGASSQHIADELRSSFQKTTPTSAEAQQPATQ
ncbi:mini-ribonuclease 3-like [Panicum virgatum]|nr:mini-ribonuclease 3-like [Panicum virgatum]XP_039846114.1 mini-ribonuclease 3-like [Panicum virgatum]